MAVDEANEHRSVQPAATDEVVRRERLLLQPAVRARRESVLALLHEEFVEHGSSGKKWVASSIVDTLSAETPTPVEVHDIDAAMLSDDVVLLTYTARSGSTATLRSSVWLRAESGEWLLRFHQGTPVPG